jgi:large subunit ribosomal protein L9
MQVILSQNVSNLGLIGDVVSVARGYYLNYLAPRSLAILANPKSVKELTHRKRIIDAKKIKAKAEATQVKATLENKNWEIAKTVGLQGRIFGSVSSSDIVALLGQQGVTVDRRMVHIAQPIKTLGDHEILVKLHSEVSATLKLQVTEMANEKAAPAETVAKVKRAAKQAETSQA